jgi:hypothetical protein
MMMFVERLIKNACGTFLGQMRPVQFPFFLSLQEGNSPPLVEIS